MKNKTLLLSATLAVALTACIPSVKPFYTQKDISYQPGLVGQWQAKEEGDTPAVWQFESTETNYYKLTIREKDNKEGQFTATLFKLKTNYFLNITPSTVEMAPSQIDLVAASLIPGHLVAHVSQLEPDLKLAFFDFDKLEKILDGRPQALAHHRESDRIVLTADTADLQKFVIEHLTDGSLFGEAGTFVRKP